MAEANTQGTQAPQGTQGQAPANNGAAANNSQGGQQAQQAQEPKWLSYIQDAAEKEEARKSYLLQNDYTKKTQELSEQRKAWESEQQKYKNIETEHANYSKWWNEFKPTYETLVKNWDKIAPILTGQVANPNPQAQTSQNNGQSPQNYFENFDVLAPEEQAKRIADYTVKEHLTQSLNALKQELVQYVTQEKQQGQNYLAILTDAFGRKFQDPSLDIPSFIQKATELSYGKFNPMEQAYQALTGPASLEKMKEEWLAKGREEGKLEAANQQQSTGAFNGATVPSFKTTPKSASQVKDAVRQLAISKGFGW